MNRGSSNTVLLFSRLPGAAKRTLVIAHDLLARFFFFQVGDDVAGNLILHVVFMILVRLRHACRSLAVFRIAIDLRLRIKFEFGTEIFLRVFHPLFDACDEDRVRLINRRAIRVRLFQLIEDAGHDLFDLVGIAFEKV